MKEGVRNANLTEVVDNLPIGEVTKLEMIHFVLYHTQRHLHQFTKICEALKNKYGQQPNIRPELEALRFLIGKWHSTGKVLAGSLEPEMKISGTDIYEWTLGGSFILHRVDVMMGDKKTEVIELIGSNDTDTGTYTLRSFDNEGNFTVMEATLEKAGVLQITGDKMRSAVSVSTDSHSMTAHWEKSEDNLKWEPWMEMKFYK